MSQRYSALIAEAKPHDVSPPAWKDETARRVREYAITLEETPASGSGSKKLGLSSGD